ncbi:hypothetical protein ABID22_003510 [Pontibacter aydingkolensis]|uniref:CHRD domain-containing protein n=1 Tax=Pontibacter aydingkolensis TaxID=1911536 RepID=A0ABS7CY95_9BACT|nr:CHRD domain-containing protein [Pontibacter aydingkolensis]MBW7468821.1 CHRD domain-containing protein [Pontibacter aydingkolensis]
MKDFNIDLRKMLVYCLMVLSCFALACDDDDDDIDVLPDDEVEFDNIQLLGANEVPAVTSSGSGTLNATYDRDTNIITYSVTWTLGNVSDNLTGMHFHGPASTTANAPVVIDITPVASNRTYQGSASGSTRPLTEAEEDELLDGRWYLNVHSTTYPNGELRGQLVD